MNISLVVAVQYRKDAASRGALLQGLVLYRGFVQGVPHTCTCLVSSGQVQVSHYEKEVRIGAPMYTTGTRGIHLSRENSANDQPLIFNRGNADHIPKVLVVCDQQDTPPVWGYLLRQQGLIVILQSSIEKAIDCWSTEMPDLLSLDLDVEHEARIAHYQEFRAVSVAPILLFLPAYHETEILEAYRAGVDDVVVKPVSPAVLRAKIVAWMRRSWIVPMDNVNPVKAGKHRLDPGRRCLIDPDGIEIKLTNLEFRLLRLLMSRPGVVFRLEETIESIWGGYGNGDQVLLKNVVYRLRRKIEADPGRPLILQSGMGGYSFQG